MSTLREVRKLETTRDRYRASVVETLEEALKEAREGKIVAIGIAIVRPNGAANTSRSESDNGITLLGAISLLHKRLLANLEDDD